MRAFLGGGGEATVGLGAAWAMALKEARPAQADRRAPSPAEAAEAAALIPVPCAAWHGRHSCPGAARAGRAPVLLPTPRGEV